MKQTKVLGFLVQVGNDTDGWVAFGAMRNRLSTANMAAGKAQRTYVNAERIDVRVIRVTETREVMGLGEEETD